MTTILPRRSAATALLLASAALAASAQTEAPPSEPSAAEKLVFVRPHLANLKPPQRLRYAFEHRGGLEPDVADRMTMELKADAGGACCTVSGRFLSGPQAFALPEVPDARANPAVLYYLEHEVRELQRLTKGQAAHFRKRIRLALVDRATVGETTVRWGGRDLAAQTVRIAPFVDDPYRQRFERLAPKEYVFVFAEGVPGGLYQIRGSVPGTAETDTLTLEEPAASGSDKR